MLDYTRTDGCRMAFLRAQLDDPEMPAGWRCGRCDGCGAPFPDVAPEADAVAAARASTRVPGVEVTPRRAWPTGMATLGVPLSGRIQADRQAEVGRAVARLDGIGWGQSLRALFAPGPDGAAVDCGLPPELRDPVLRVLDAWRPAVTGIVVVASDSRPLLVDHLAAGVGRHLGVPVVGRVAPRDGVPAGRHDVNSATRLAGVWRRLALDVPPATAAGLPGRAVLLVDDRIISGWTLTVAAALLRDAGAAAVHPFVLGVG